MWLATLGCHVAFTQCDHSISVCNVKDLPTDPSRWTHQSLLDWYRPYKLLPYPNLVSMVSQGAAKQQGSTCAGRAKVKMHNLVFITCRFYPLMGSMGLRGWSQVLALPAVTPAQHKVVLWVMQIGRLALYHLSAVCSGISHTSQQFVQWNICAAGLCSCNIADSFILVTCLLYVSESLSRPIVTETTDLWVACCELLLACSTLFCIAGVAVCPWLGSRVQIKLSTHSGFSNSELKRALGLVARHLQLCSFNLVDNFILTLPPGWMRLIYRWQVVFYCFITHLQTCRWERLLWLHLTVIVCWSHSCVSFDSVTYCTGRLCHRLAL